MRLGLLSPKKHCAVMNTFVDTGGILEGLTDEPDAIEMQRYYKKHLRSYTMWQLRQQVIANKKARKRELLAQSEGVPVESIEINSVEVSDVSDSEIIGAQTSNDEGGFSTAEDLQEMFSDRRMDEDEKYFINQASTQLSLDDYMPATEIIRHEDASEEMSYYEAYEPDVELSIEHKDELTLEMNEMGPMIYTFPRGSWSKFNSPTALPKLQLFPYYLLDGASVLTVMALGVQLNDVCADYCAAPGGKSLALMMSMKPRHLLCNDTSISRLKRISRVMDQYIPDINYRKSTLKLSNENAAKMVYPDTFDKIIVDVPCINDRNAIETLDNNIFKTSRTEERIGLPKLQCNILKAALRSLKPKGSVIYSTCTLSPIENDGVVQNALIQLQEEGCELKFVIINLKEAFRPFRGLYKFNTKFKYGQQVVPNVCSNFGPMYISKITRLK